MKFPRPSLDGWQKVYAPAFPAWGLPVPVSEHVFDSVRKFRFDFAWPDFKVALEIQGATWAHGAHSRGAGQKVDREKRELAQIQGWITLECTPEEFLAGRAVPSVQGALTARGWRKGA